jgi:rhodanese-related sulfurtransferase
VDELAQLEHAYAPPYAPAVEPLAVAACAAQNQEDGVEAEPPTAPFEDVIDVRLPEERRQRPVEAVAVDERSVVELRDASHTDTPQEGLVVCERGARSAEAVRLLQNRGGLRYLGGGLQWRDAAARSKAEPDPPEAPEHASTPTHDRALPGED